MNNEPLTAGAPRLEPKVPAAASREVMELKKNKYFIQTQQKPDGQIDGENVDSTSEENLVSWTLKFYSMVTNCESRHRYWLLLSVMKPSSAEPLTLASRTWRFLAGVHQSCKKEQEFGYSLDGCHINTNPSVH